MRRAEGDRGASVVVALAGIATAVVVLVASTITLAVVEAADEGREPAAVRALFERDNIAFLAIGWTSAAFYAGIAVSSLGTGSLPRALGWIAAALAVLFPICFFGIFSESDEGGVLGGIFFLGLVINFFWILATSIVMLRSSPATGTADGSSSELREEQGVREPSG